MTIYLAQLLFRQEQMENHVGWQLDGQPSEHGRLHRGTRARGCFPYRQRGTKKARPNARRKGEFPWLSLQLFTSGIVGVTDRAGAEIPERAGAAFWQAGQMPKNPTTWLTSVYPRSCSMRSMPSTEK